MIPVSSIRCLIGLPPFPSSRIQLNEGYEMYFVSRTKYILCTSFRDFDRGGSNEGQNMYFISMLWPEMGLFREMKYTKCPSLPRFLPILPNEIHEMYYVHARSNGMWHRT